MWDGKEGYEETLRDSLVGKDSIHISVANYSSLLGFLFLMVLLLSSSNTTYHKREWGGSAGFALPYYTESVLYIVYIHYIVSPLLIFYDCFLSSHFPEYFSNSFIFFSIKNGFLCLFCLHRMAALAPCSGSVESSLAQGSRTSTFLFSPLILQRRRGSKITFKITVDIYSL